MADLAELGKRALACKHWRWMPGMLMLGSRHRVTQCGEGWAGDGGAREPWVVGAESAPDFSDAATLGCLLALVRAAWGDQGIYTSSLSSGRWTVRRGDGSPVTPWRTRRCTEIASLVVALELANDRTGLFRRRNQ